MVQEDIVKGTFPYDKSNLIKDLFFTWIFPLVNFYRKIPATEFNVFDLPDRFVYVDDLYKIKKEWKRIRRSPRPNIFYAIWPIFKKRFIISVLPGTISYNCALINAVMLYYIVRYMNDQTSVIVPYIVIYFISVGFNMLCMSYTFRSTQLLVAKLKACLTEIIFHKTLKAGYAEISQGSQSGKLMSLISADLELLDGISTLPIVFSMPLLLTGSTILLWFNLGVSGVIGLLVKILHLPLILYFGKMIGTIRLKTAWFGDSRMQKITNLIEGIRIVKLYGWESPYLDSLFDIRNKEMKQHSKKTIISSINKSIYTGSTGLILFVTFSCYITLGNKLDPSTAFSAITILNLCNSIINHLGSTGAKQIFLIMASFKRISQAMIMKDKKINQDKEKNIQETIENEYSVILKKCKFVWKEPKNTKIYNTVQNTKGDFKSEFYLKKLNFKVRKGEFVIVIGAVGSGKTTLLLGLLNEIFLKNGSMSLIGELAFACENPWIVSGTIKENIISSQIEDIEFYNDVIKKCCLEKDLELFKDFGDDTMIGDRGITLSGGQKARIALARAVYTNRDIILLDDPLSAVDPEVCLSLFNNCIKGILKEKTVILATHQTQFVSQADKILILDDGKQVFFGTYEELLSQNFDEYLGKMKQTEGIETTDEPKIESKKIERLVKIKDQKFIVAEETTKGNVPFKIYIKFFMLGFKNPIFLTITILIQIAVQFCYLAVLYWVAYWINASDQNSSFYIYWLAIIVFVLYLLSFLRVFSILFPLHNSGRHLHNLAIKGLACTESLYFDKNPTGRMLNRFGKDTSQVDEILTNYLCETLTSLTNVLGNFIVVFIISPYSAIMLVIIALFFLLILRYFNLVINDFKRIEQVTKSPILSLVNSSIHGLTTIRSLNLEKSLKLKMKDAIEVNYKSQCAYQMILRAFEFYLDFGPNILSLVNIIVLVNLKDRIDPSLAAMSMSITLGMIGYVGPIFKALIETDNYMTSVQRLFEYKELKPEGFYDLNESFVITKGKIEISDLSLRYRQNYDLALKNLSFTIQAGMKTGIVGRTGAGKSSIMQVLFRLTNPENGTIYIDGQDYMKAGLHDLRKQMSVIPQSATLFIASLKDNLDPFHEHSNEEIIKVLKKVRLGNLLGMLPNGLDSQINSDELSLSAGQKQLVCLARAILRKNKILMIDEATANMDSETDEFIQRQLNKQFKGCTMLIIAHRLRTIIDSDWIVVMEAGTSVEEGDPKGLVNNPESEFMKMIQHTGPEESIYLLSKLSSY